MIKTYCLKCKTKDVEIKSPKFSIEAEREDETDKNLAIDGTCSNCGKYIYKSVRLRYETDPEILAEAKKIEDAEEKIRKEQQDIRLKREKAQDTTAKIIGYPIGIIIAFIIIVVIIAVIKWAFSIVF